MEFQDVEGVLEKAIEVISEHQGLINAYVTVSEARSSVSDIYSISSNQTCVVY